MSDRRQTVRDACRDRKPLDGSDAKALEHALTITERERDRMRSHFEALRSDVAAALAYRRNVGGQQAGVPPFASCPPSTLMQLERLCRDALEGS